MKKSTKEKIRNTIAVSFPKLWYRILRNKTYKTYKVINDLTILPSISRPYDPSSTYVTMFAEPSKYYEKINRNRVFDKDGIPLYQEKYYNLVQIAQYGLSEFGYYSNTGKKDHLDHAKKVCEWLVHHQDEKTGFWTYHFEYTHNSTGCFMKDWACAMGQGQAASLLTRMWRIDQDEKYLVAAHNAFNMFDVPVEQGGLLAKFDGHPFYEEYPTNPHSFTLNGMIFATFGLYDYLQVKEDDRIEKLWKDGVKTVEYVLPLYDDDIFSNYDLTHLTARVVPKVKGDKYHILHISLLQNLESVAPSPTFEYYIRKWAKMSGFTIK